VRRTVLCDRGDEEFRREAAARSLRLNLRQADADALPFADESFDYVLSWSVRIVGLFIDLALRTGPSLDDIEVRHQAKVRGS
jgi:hypothetical protein